MYQIFLDPGLHRKEGGGHDEEYRIYLKWELLNDCLAWIVAVDKVCGFEDVEGE